MSRNGLFIKGNFVPPPPYKPDHPVTLEMDRLRKLDFPMKLQFLQDIQESQCVKLYFHNVQSFNLHKTDVEADLCPLSADILCFVEPHTLENDDIGIPGFRIAYRKDATGDRHNSSGVLVFLKDEFCDRRNINDIEILEVAETPGIDILVFKLLLCTYIVIYRSPSSSLDVFDRTLQDILARVEGEFFLCGDINIDLCVELTTGPSKKFIQVMEEKGASSLTKIEEYSTDDKSHIDVAYSNRDRMNCWYYESYYSYHSHLCRG